MYFWLDFCIMPLPDVDLSAASVEEMQELLRRCKDENRGRSRTPGGRHNPGGSRVPAANCAVRCDLKSPTEGAAASMAGQCSVMPQARTTGENPAATDHIDAAAVLQGAVPLPLIIQDIRDIRDRVEALRAITRSFGREQQQRQRQAQC